MGDLDKGSSYTMVSGVMHDGNTYSYRLPAIGMLFFPSRAHSADSQGVSDSEGDTLIGNCVDGWWIRAPAGQNTYVLSKGEARTVRYKTEDAADLKNKLF